MQVVFLTWLRLTNTRQLTNSFFLFIMSHEEIELYLAGLRNPDKEVRANSVEQLVKSGSEAVPHVLNLLTDDNWIIRYRAAEALGGIRDVDTVDSLIQLTTDEKDHVRYMATKSLGYFHDPRIHPVLIMMLSDDHSYTRRIAAAGLVAEGDSTAYIPLQKALDGESDPDTRASLLDAIRQIKK